MIYVLYQNVLLLRLNWGNNLYFLLVIIDFQVKLQMNLRTIIKFSNIDYISVLLDSYWRF